MVRHAGLAHSAVMAAAVDIRNYPFADKGGVGGLINDADKFMAQCAAKRIIAANDFQVGIADTCPGQANQNFTGFRYRFGYSI